MRLEIIVKKLQLKFGTTLRIFRDKIFAQIQLELRIPFTLR
jgi:hypothetical protein